MRSSVFGAVNRRTRQVVVLKSSQWAISYLPLSVVFLFTALVFANAALKSTLRITGLSPGELGIVFIMSLVGASIPTWGTSTYMIAVIAAPKFFASPENQWQEKVVQYAKDWLMPRDDIALKWFYNGLPAGESIPWGAWIAPLFWQHPSPASLFRKSNVFYLHRTPTLCRYRCD